MTSCSTNNNMDYTYRHISSIESARNTWITIMEEAYKKDTIDQSHLRDDYFYYDTPRMHEAFDRLDMCYELDMNTKKFEDLLRKRSEFTRMFYSCENLLMTKEKLSKLILIEKEIDFFLLEALHKLETE